MKIRSTILIYTAAAAAAEEQIITDDYLAWAEEGCKCSDTLEASNNLLSREALGEMPNEYDAEPVPIVRRNSSLTYEQYVTEYFAFGVPVIIEGLVEDWPLFKIAGPGNPETPEGDRKFKQWIVDTFGKDSRYEQQRATQDDGTYVYNDVLSGGKPFVDKALKKGQDKGFPEGCPEGEADFTGLYDQTTSDENFQPFNGLWDVPTLFESFLDPAMRKLGHGDFMERQGGSAYVGGPPNAPTGNTERDGARPVVPTPSVQVRGRKRWRIQSALTATQLSAPLFAGLLGDRNVVYTGDVYPGDMLLWPVQLFHDTTSDSFSYAFQQHLEVSMVRGVYEMRNSGQGTFTRPAPEASAADAPANPGPSHQDTKSGSGDTCEQLELPITMFYQKLMAHFACNDQLHGWYCANSQCPENWIGPSAFDASGSSSGSNSNDWSGSNSDGDEVRDEMIMEDDAHPESYFSKYWGFVSQWSK